VTGKKKKVVKPKPETEELTLGDTVDEKPTEPYSFQSLPANEDAVIKGATVEETAAAVETLSEADPDLNDPVKEAATTPANVTLILRSGDDVQRARDLYEQHRPKKHSGNLAGIRVNERQEPRVMWRRA